MFEEFKLWARKDWLNISLALLCAVISVLPAVIPFFRESHSNGKSELYDINFWFAFCQCVVVVIGLIVVSFRYRPLALLEISDRFSLQDYIEEECHIKQTQKNDSLTAYRVVRVIVKQFYAAWIFIWVIWLFYYGVEMYFWSEDSFAKNKFFVANISSIKFILDFLSSSALFGVYIILNNITVEISNRCEDHYSNIYWSAIGLGILFIIGVVFQITYLSNLSDPNYIRYELFISILLSAFGCISFVLVLGKLNSNYLNVPRIFMFPLYIYAVAQAYSFFYGGTVKCTKETMYQPIIDVIGNIYPWVMSFGKVILLITLSWILHKKRLIFYIVHRSLSMTKVKEQLNEFNRYMS